MFIEWLRNGLRQPGKTQRGLADALGVAPSAVSRLLNRERELLASEIPKAAAYLNIPPPFVGRQTVEPVQTIPVRYAVATGVWREASAVTIFNPPTIPVVSDERYKGMEQFAARIEGDSRYLICVSYGEVRTSPRSGDMVLVERVRGDLKEHICCTVYAKDDGKYVLQNVDAPYAEYPIDGKGIMILGLCIGRFQLF